MYFGGLDVFGGMTNYANFKQLYFKTIATRKTKF